MILKVENIAKSFDGFVAVAGVSFQVNNAELCSIIGPNGAGKTTLFNLITGHLPLDRGRVIFNDIDISHLPAMDRYQDTLRSKHKNPQPFSSE